MNSKKDSKKIKPKISQTFQSPIEKRQNHDSDLNPQNLQDLSPFRTATYGRHHERSIQGQIRYSRTQLIIVETPYISPRPLDYIMEDYHSICSILEFPSENEEYESSQEELSQELLSSFQEKQRQQVKANSEDTAKPTSSIKMMNYQLKTATLLKYKKQLPKKILQTATKKVICNCKKTKCLKLYCDCFRINQTCEGCNCVGCHNLPVYTEQRHNSMLTLMERNPEAFKPKIDEQKHAKGCHCRKSNCLKKYCQCYQAGLKCGTNCKCQQCKNCEDGDNHEEPNNGMSSLLVNIQQLMREIEPENPRKSDLKGVNRVSEMAEGKRILS